MSAAEEIQPPVKLLEVGSAEFDIPDVTRFTIDQAVVDGEVDGRDIRAPIKMLVRVAFKGVHAPDPVFHDFKDALVDDDRFIDIVGKRYGYTPEVSPGSQARACHSAIVNGRGIFTEEERKTVMDLMEFYTETVYQHMNTAMGHIFSVREISGALKEVGVNPTYSEYGGFLAHMRRDPRFRPLGDGRVVLTGYSEAPTELPPELPRVEDFEPLITEALPYIFTGSARVFKSSALLGTLKALGTFVRQDQLETLYEQLHLHPDITVLDNGRYKITGDIERIQQETIVSEPAREMSLDAMIRHTIGKGSSRTRKPRGKRRGGWKKLSNMDGYFE